MQENERELVVLTVDLSGKTSFVVPRMTDYRFSAPRTPRVMDIAWGGDLREVMVQSIREDKEVLGLHTFYADRAPKSPTFTTCLKNGTDSAKVSRYM